MDFSGFARALQTQAGRMREQVADGLEDAAYDVLREAQKRVPVDTGGLRASGKVKVNRRELTAEVSFTDPEAVIVHERVDVSHDRGQPHFLSSALVASKAKVLDTIADAVDK